MNSDAIRESVEFDTPENVYMHASVVFAYVVPRLTFADVYALTHTCKTMRRIIDESTYWLDFLRTERRGNELYLPSAMSQTTVSKLPSAVRKRIALASMRCVCFACGRNAIIFELIGAGETHRVCYRCVSTRSIGRAVYNYILRMTNVTLPYFRRVGTNDSDEAPDSLMCFREHVDLADELRRLTYGRNAGRSQTIAAEYANRLRVAVRLPRRPYIFSAIDDTEASRGRRRSPKRIAFVNYCAVHAPNGAAPLTSNEATRCQLNACRTCCARVHSANPLFPALCDFHRTRPPPKRRRRSVENNYWP